MAESHAAGDHFVDKDPITSPRVVHAEQISARRFHQKVRISSTEDLDEELKAWLQEVYVLSE